MKTTQTILFDGVCNFCTASVMFIIRRDRNAVFRFTAIQSESGRKLLNTVNVAPELIQSIVLVSDGAVYIRSDAALKIAEKMDFPWNLLFAFKILPRGFRDWLYSIVSKHRYRLIGARSECLIPSEDIKSRFLP